jgi:hypothetical protein
MLVVKTELTSLSEISAWRCYCWIERSYSLAMVFPKSMHLFIISQPTIATSLWWFPVWWFRFRERPWVKLNFWRNLSSLEFRMRIVTPFDKPHVWRKFVGSLPWNRSCRLLVWNLADLSSRVSLSKVVCWYSTFLPTLSQSYYIHYNLEGTCDGRIVINRFQWPLLCHCLIEVYLTPRLLYLPFASHSLLAIK